MFKSKKLGKFKTIEHGFFNRKGGFSKGIYKSLNCGVGSKDKITDVKKNQYYFFKTVINSVIYTIFHQKFPLRAQLVKLFEFSVSTATSCSHY